LEGLAANAGLRGWVMLDRTAAEAPAAEDGDALLLEGNRLLRAGQHVDAARVLARARALLPGDFQALVLCGEAQARAGRAAEAKATLETCRQLDPDGPKTRKLAALISNLEKE
jgi:Flp pilus assembly protein TadD